MSPRSARPPARRDRASGARRIPRLGRTLIGPCTTTIRGIPSEVLLEPGDDPVPRTSVVNLDSVESVSLAALVERLGRLGDERMLQICKALEIAVSCDG